MSDIFDKAISMAEMTIIKRDFDLLKKLALSLTPDIQTQLVPYSALFCYEVIEYLNKNGANIVIEQTSNYSIKDIRQKAKFFDLSINKLLQSIENIDSLQDEYYINLMKYPQFGYWNIHTNLGICFDDQKNIVSNTHYAYYLFQDEKMISKPKDSMSGNELNGEEIKGFAYDMGRIIGSISDGLTCISDFMTADVYIDNIYLHTQDFNTNRCMTGDSNHKIIRLFLLHVLSSIGFILHILKKIIIRDSGLLLRFEYITYHYALFRLEGILKYCLKTNADSKLISLLNGFDYSNNNLRKTEFRNCMMHFGLKDANGTPLITESQLNLSLPFCGLVESQFGISYELYKTDIENALIDIYNKIKDYLDFELLIDKN